MEQLEQYLEHSRLYITIKILTHTHTEVNLSAHIHAYAYRLWGWVHSRQYMLLKIKITPRVTVPALTISLLVFHCNKSIYSSPCERYNYRVDK